MAAVMSKNKKRFSHLFAAINNGSWKMKKSYLLSQISIGNYTEMRIFNLSFFEIFAVFLCLITASAAAIPVAAASVAATTTATAAAESPSATAAATRSTKTTSAAGTSRFIFGLIDF